MSFLAIRILQPIFLHFIKFNYKPTQSTVLYLIYLEKDNLIKSLLFQNICQYHLQPNLGSSNVTLCQPITEFSIEKYKTTQHIIWTGPNHNEWNNKLFYNWVHRWSLCLKNDSYNNLHQYVSYLFTCYNYIIWASIFILDIIDCLLCIYLYAP